MMTDEELGAEAATEAAEEADDKRHRDRGRGTFLAMAHACGLVFWLVVGTCLGLLLPHMPTLEGMVRPIVKAKKVDTPPVTRTPLKVCFSMRLWKQHEGLPIIFQYFVEVRQAQHWLAPSELNAHLATVEDDVAPDDYDDHEVGKSWVRRWCAPLSHDVPPTSAIRVTGFAKHHVHPIFDTDSPMPAFEVGPSE